MRELVPWGLFDFKPTKLSGSHTGDDKTECFGCPLYSAELVRGELDDGDPPRRQILLIPEVLIRRHEHVKVLLRQSNKVSVLDSRPSHATGGVALMPDQHPAERPRHTLIQEDSHEAVSSAASLLSSTRHASSRGTEGKHSMNSSRE